MKQGLYTGVVLVIVSILLAVACAPARAPAPAPAAPAADAAWDKVIAAAKAEGKVTLYTFGLTGDTGTAVSKAFEEKYGIKVESVTGVGTVLIEKIKSEKAAGKPSADTVDTSSALIMAAKRGGLTESLSDIPVLAEKKWRAPPTLDAEGHAVNYSLNYYAIYVNTDLVKPEEEPKSWLDLLNPKWKGKVTIATPVTSPEWVRIYYLLVVKRKVLPADYMQKFAANQPRIVATVREPPAVAARGETPLSCCVSVVADPLITKGAPIKPIVPKEGTLILPAPTITLVKGAPHPNAARLFVNWLLSSEGQAVYGKAQGTMSIRTDVPDFRPARAQVALEKVFVTDVASEEEVDKLVAAGTIAEIFGVKK